MKIDITAEVRVARPPGDVAAYMTDPANDPQWIGGVSEARLEGEPPVRPGSRVARVAGFLGKRIEYVNEVLALDSEHLDMRSVVAPFPMHITYSFTPDGGGGTLVRNRVRGEPGGFFAVFGPLLAPMVKRSVQKDLERLRDLLEARPS
ncbi:MAG TPA: SRPBCC family protein [Solirubrobacteraceae bacterium]|nr:SRPBCC family protein [Solirubrobacteraceae bacterium]